MNASALIAEDEPLLAQALLAELARAWPTLRVLATVGDGTSAVAQALALRPDVLFFDIRMPGLGGLEAAAAIADDWPADLPLPALVFVTAHDEFALQAFDAQALDYLLKPVQAERLQRTVARVQGALRARAADAAPVTAPVTTPDWAGLRALLAASAGPARPRLRHLMPAWATACCAWPSTRCWPSRPPTNTCVCSPASANASSARRSGNCCRSSIRRCSGRSTAAPWCGWTPSIA
jgi:CheY-like chemotaxis protein